MLRTIIIRELSSRGCNKKLLQENTRERCMKIYCSKVTEISQKRNTGRVQNNVKKIN